MAKSYSNQDILDILHRIDAGIQPTTEETRALNERTRLLLVGPRATYIPDSIGWLTNLQTLDFSLTPITTLPGSIGKLTKLQSLNLSHTPITTLPEAIGQLSSLKKLTLGHTNLSSLPKSLGKLTQLKELYLWETNISELPDCVKAISSLEKLSLRNSGVSVLPKWIGKMPSLNWLDLAGLKLQSIPASLAFRGLRFVEQDNFSEDAKHCVNLFGVTLTEQKKSVFIETPSLIPDLYRKKEQVPVRACKVIFLGDGGVGKSYTIRRFCAGGKKESKSNPYLTEETHGVEIGDYKVKNIPNSFDIHFWDFGGQEILHSMHRCFLTEETCYVVMVRTRETESTARARYWLRAVESAAPNSPVLLYVNCWGNAKGDRAIDAPRLKEEFPQIRKIVYCSAKIAKEDEFRREFMVPLIDMAAGSDMCGKTIPHEWDQLICSIQDLQRNAIKTREQNYLDKKQYLRLCKEAGIGNEKTADLLTLLNNLGVCFSYHRDRESFQELSDYKLLNPAWLTNALYAIVEEGTAPAQAGLIKLEAIRAMLHNKPQDWFPRSNYRRTVPELVYEDDECQYILNVAEVFRLCYRVDSENVFFPALCGTDTPKDALSTPKGYPQRVSYLLRYRYLPDSVLHQLMIRCMQSGMAVKPRWLKGMVVKVWDLHTACIRIAEEGSLQIDIYSKGEQPSYALFWMLRKEIEEINQRIHLSAKEFILDGENEFPLGSVLAAARKNTVLFDQEGNEYNAQKLLGNFYEEPIVQTMKVKNGSIAISISKREYHICPQNDKYLRKALYKAYNEICPYCGRPISSIRAMQVDHIFATKAEKCSALQDYLEYLNSCGFNLKKPDYIENYFPAHVHCNRDKANRINEYSLPYWHDIAAQHTPRVIQLMMQYKSRD